MPVGYVAGNQYRLDHNIDRYSALDVWQRLIREAGKRSLSVEIRYGYVSKGYMAEVCTLKKFREGGDWIMTSVALKASDNPLHTMVLALHQAVTDPLMLALYLEAETVLLGMALKDARHRESKQAALEDKIERVLDQLGDMLRKFVIVEPLSADPSDVAAAQWENIQSGAVPA